MRGPVRRLSPELANQIAAGEVIERPASIVKELVENALDAGATRITISTEHGGKRRVRVDDDGCGMGPEDAMLALERHATSKIGQASDLGAISTLGFRGEALPSIASVSKLTLRTRPADRDAGVEIQMTDGVWASMREIGAPVGTSVDVADIFFNLPARRKFLKSDGAESAQISKLVTQLALGYPAVGFTLRSGDRTMVACPPASSLVDRFHQVYGERPDLIPIEKEAGGLKLVGFVAALTDQGPVRGPQNVFVNGRIVKDRTIAHAIGEAYSVATIKVRSPEVHLFLEISPARVDVNVHPTKAEVRFLEQSLVHEVMRRALAEALGRDRAPELQLRPDASIPAGPVARMIPEVLRGDPGGAERWAAATAAFRRPEPTDGESGQAGESNSRDERVVESDAATAEIAPMVPLGQFRDTFIIAVDQDGVAIVDQHVAHERVLFEQVVERLGSGDLESQGLLEPLLIEVPVAQRDTLLARRDELERCGFAIEPFGGDSLRVTAVPALLRPADCAQALTALSDDLDGLEREAPVDEALRRIAATMACHAAVKAHDPLSLEKMRYILDELRRTAYSTVCPHGRPVVLRLTRREIEKNFQRI